MLLVGELVMEIRWQPAVYRGEHETSWVPCAVALGWGDTVWFLVVDLYGGLSRRQATPQLKFLKAQSFTQWNDACEEADRLLAGRPYKPVAVGPEQR